MHSRNKNHNSHLKQSGLQARRNMPEVSSDEQSATDSRKKRKIDSEVFQNESLTDAKVRTSKRFRSKEALQNESLTDAKVRTSKRSKSKEALKPDSEHQSSSRRTSSRIKKTSMESREELLDNISDQSYDTKSSSKGQKVTDQDLLARYSKRLEDLKKNSIFSTTPVFETICSRYETSRNDSKAAAMSKYMRNKFEYFGIPTPQRKALHVDLWTNVKTLSSSDLRTLAHQTWFSPEREFQYFTVALLEREVFRLYDDDDSPISDRAVKTLDFVKTFIEHPSSWWDTVDALSSNVVGSLVRKYPSELLPEMDKWNASSCFWLCRTSILYQLSYKKDTDSDRLFRYCLRVADEEEFFIRKAIGWALRQYYRTNPDAVRNFVQKHKNRLSTLSVREALKHDK